MDKVLVSTLRKKFDRWSTTELRRSFANEDSSMKPEEREALRQLLDERSRRGNRFLIAGVSAVVMGAIGAFGTWWINYPGELTLLTGVGCAIFGFLSFYVPGLFGLGHGIFAKQK